MKSAVFLDRDGVLCDPIVRQNKAYAPLALNQFLISGDAAAQVVRLRSAGFLCILFTNQPDVGRGDLSLTLLEKMHKLLRAQIALDDLFVCTHDKHEGCFCRKPKPGMILEAAKKWDLQLSASYAIGDRGCDVDAGRAAGCYSILIEKSYSNCPTADARVSSLSEAVDIILKKNG